MLSPRSYERSIAAIAIVYGPSPIHNPRTFASRVTVISSSAQMRKRPSRRARPNTARIATIGIAEQASSAGASIQADARPLCGSRHVTPHLQRPTHTLTRSILPFSRPP